MREIRKSGSEGGGIETNRCFLPLSVNTAPGLLGCPVKPGNDAGGIKNALINATVDNATTDNTSDTHIPAAILSPSCGRVNRPSKARFTAALRVGEAIFAPMRSVT